MANIIYNCSQYVTRYLCFIVILIVSFSCASPLINYKKVHGLAGSMTEGHAKNILSKYVGKSWVENPHIIYDLTEWECVDNSGLFEFRNRIRQRHNCAISDIRIEITSKHNCIRTELLNPPYPTERYGRPDHRGYKGEIRRLAHDYYGPLVCPINVDDIEEIEWILAAFIALDAKLR